MSDSEERLKITLAAKKPEDFEPKLSKIRDKAANLSRRQDKGLVNENGGRTSIALRDNKVNIAASTNANSKVDGKSQQIINVSFEEKTITNRRSIETDELAINGHKINPDLWEYTDFKVYQDQYGGAHQVGRFNILGSVLVKAWDHQLGRYMLIRRPAFMPMFAPILNVPEINEALDIQDPSKLVHDYPAKQQSQSAAEWYKQVLATKDERLKNGENLTDTQFNTPNGGGGASDNTMLNKTIQYAIQLAGSMCYYRYGGGGPNEFDCTGFVSYVFNKTGWPIPVCHGTAFDTAFLGAGFTRLPYPGAQGLLPGDVLNTSSHTELYIGNGKQAGAHSSASGVSVNDLDVSRNWEYIFRYQK